MAEKLKSITMENVRIFSRNFEGAPTRFDPQGGKRRFCVFLDDQDTYERMMREGWNVKHLKPRDDDPDADPMGRPFIEVEVKFTSKVPPKIVMIGSRGRTDLNQKTCKLLDWAPATNIDLIVNPYEWDVNGNQGVKAYLKSIFYTIYEDELDLKYADVPESSSQAMLAGGEYEDDPTALPEDDNEEEYVRG